jgi:hypothetical protein
MKIKPEHYAHMRDAIGALHLVESVEDYRTRLAADPRVKDVDVRLRWDLLHAAVPSRWVCDNVYPYANDTHLDTALRRIVRELFAL